MGGGFNLQPAELCKIFTALALAKFLSRQETDFSKLKFQLIAGAIANCSSYTFDFTTRIGFSIGI
jgi:rod shape determining protein RodA